MQLQLNGEPVEIDLNGPPTVRRLLEARGLGKAVCAVEVNTTLVPKRQHDDHELADGDIVEIVTLVGGG